MEMFPYLAYYAFRFQPSLETQLPEELSTYLLSILKSETPFYQMVDLVLRSIDFLTVAMEQDKAIFKTFIE